MKKLVMCIGILLIAGTILYAQERQGYPPEQLQAPETMGHQQPGMIGEPNWLKEDFPGKYEKLMQLREQNPQGFEKEFGMLQRFKNEDAEAYAMSKKLFQFEKQVRELTEKYNIENSAKEKEKIKNEIQDVLNKAFDLKLKIEERRLNQLKEKLSELEKSFQTRKEHKDEIVKKRLESLLEEEDYLRW